MENFIIRDIKKEDNRELAEMIRSVFREYGVMRPNTVYDDPTTDDLYSLFKNDRSVLYILEKDNRIVGSAGIYPTVGLPGNYCELVKFYISPQSRGKGYGRQLMEKCFESAIALGYTNMYLESFPEFMTALGLYEKAGFNLLDTAMGNSGHTGCSVWMHKKL